MGLVRRVREAARVNWDVLSWVGRLAVAGVVASAVLAVALGLFIPHVVERQALESRLEMTTSLVRVLEQQGLVPDMDEPLGGAALARFDGVVRGGLLGGENLRVKLWNADGEIVYSDAQSLIGQRFPVTPLLASTFEGESAAEISDLLEEENANERSLADRLLELYIPLQEGDEVVGVFEVYQDLEPLSSHMRAVQTAVWISVGAGLTALLVFLTVLFGATAGTLVHQRQAATARADELELLLETSRQLSRDPAMDRTAPGVLRALADHLDLTGACLLVDGEGTWSVSDRSSDGEGETTWALSVPLHAGSDPIGALSISAGRPLADDPRERVLLRGVAEQVAMAAARSRHYADLQRMTDARGDLLRKLVRAQEEERRHLVGDLHDGLGQALTRLLYGIRGARARLSPDQTEVEEELSRLEALTDEQSVNLRRYMAAIRPALLEDLGLARAIEASCRQQELEGSPPIDLTIDPLPDLPQEVAITTLRAVQEAIINARKHADAAGISVSVAERRGVLRLDVSDDGRGSTAIRDGVGLTYLKERVASLGGSVEIDSNVGRGTAIAVRIPLEGHDGRTDPGR